MVSTLLTKNTASQKQVLRYYMEISIYCIFSRMTEKK